jgi:hypothetical protein
MLPSILKLLHPIAIGVKCFESANSETSSWSGGASESWRPFFYHRGKRVAGFRASKGLLSFFIMEGKALDKFRGVLDPFDHSSTIVRFTPENPFPEELVKKLVLARIEEIERKFLG